MSSAGPEARDLREAEDIAARGLLLSALAHELNNQLTNLMLGADSLRFGGGPDSVEMLVQQAQNIATITRSIQDLGRPVSTDTSGRTQLGDVAEGLRAWHRSARPDEPPVEVTSHDESIEVAGQRARLVLALSLMLRPCVQWGDGSPLAISVGRESVRRSAWSGSDETVEMAVIRLGRGEPPVESVPLLRTVVDDFFKESRSGDEVRLMAAWEVFRKVRGRPSARMDFYGGLDAAEWGVVISLPLCDG